MALLLLLLACSTHTDAITTVLPSQLHILLSSFSGAMQLLVGKWQCSMIQKEALSKTLACA
jgi:hypothetical protein